MNGSTDVLHAATVAGAAAAIFVVGASGRPRLRAGRRVGAAPPRRLGGRPQLGRFTVRIVGVIGALLVLGWLATAAGITLIAITRRLRPIREAQRRRRQAQRQLPEAIERVILLVHAGLTPQLAIRAAARSVPTAIGPAFEAVVHRIDRGGTLAEALDALTDVLGPRAAPLADALAAAERYGLPLEPMLDQLARDARAERRRLDEADARRLPVRMAFPLVTCTLPSFVLVAIAPAVIAALSSLDGTSW